MTTYKTLTRSEAYGLMRAGCKPQCRHNRERFYYTSMGDWVGLDKDTYYLYESPVDGYHDEFRIEVE
jgi:hypothetical protein